MCIRDRLQGIAAGAGGRARAATPCRGRQRTSFGRVIVVGWSPKLASDRALSPQGESDELYLEESRACCRRLDGLVGERDVDRAGGAAGRVELRHHLDRGVGEPAQELGAVRRGHVEGDRHQGEGVLRHRLCRRDRGHALQQGACRLVRQQIRHGGGRPRQW